MVCGIDFGVYIGGCGCVPVRSWPGVWSGWVIRAGADLRVLGVLDCASVVGVVVFAVVVVVVVVIVVTALVLSLLWHCCCWQLCCVVFAGCVEEEIDRIVLRKSSIFVVTRYVMVAVEWMEFAVFV